MTKNVVLLVMALGMAMGVIAQDRVAIEKEAVRTRSTEFFNDIDKAFANHNKYDGPNWRKVGKNGTQFVVDDLAKFGVKATKIQKQFDALEKDKQLSAQISHYDMGIEQSQSDKSDKNCYTSTHEVKAIVTKDDLKSVVTNEITIKWMVNWSKYDTEKNEWKKGSFGERGKAVTIVSISNKQIPVLSSEKATIANNVNAAIRNWYNNINSNVNLRQANLNPDECVRPIVFTENLSNKTFVSADDITGAQQITVGKEKSVPSFKVMSNNPNKYISAAEQQNYDNPEIGWNVQPTFTVSIDMETGEATIASCSYENTMVKPEADAQKVARLKAAKSAASAFGDKLNQFAQEPRGKAKNQMKKEILDMFVDKNAKAIQFSLIKNSEEDQKYIDDPTTPKSYLEHLPAAEFTMDYGNARFDGSADRVIVPYTQTYKQIYPDGYKGNKYADKTNKEMCLVYNQETDTWQIESITAQKGSTELINND